MRNNVAHTEAVIYFQCTSETKQDTVQLFYITSDGSIDKGDMSLPIKQPDNQYDIYQEQAGYMATTTSDSLTSLAFVLKGQKNYKASKEMNRQAPKRKEKWVHHQQQYH